MQRGWQLGRVLTAYERIALAVSATCPTHLLTVTTRCDDRADLGRNFELLVRRVRRGARRKVPLVYFGTMARAASASGWHLHMLLWERPHVASFRCHAEHLGLGRVLDAERIQPATPLNALMTVTYVISQQEPVFGRRLERPHEPREKHARRLRYPHAATLREHHPELLHVLDLAKDKSLSDKEMFAALPRFIREEAVYGEPQSEGAQDEDNNIERES